MEPSERTNSISTQQPTRHQEEPLVTLCARMDTCRIFPATCSPGRSPSGQCPRHFGGRGPRAIAGVHGRLGQRRLGHQRRRGGLGPARLTHPALAPSQKVVGREVAAFCPVRLAGAIAGRPCRRAAGQSTASARSLAHIPLLASHCAPGPGVRPAFIAAVTLSAGHPLRGTAFAHRERRWRAPGRRPALDLVSAPSRVLNCSETWAKWGSSRRLAYKMATFCDDLVA